ncbi:hypothetical protein BKA93DRAFT_929371 [Sparassis latifolia]
MPERVAIPSSPIATDSETRILQALPLNGITVPATPEQHMLAVTYQNIVLNKFKDDSSKAAVKGQAEQAVMFVDKIAGLTAMHQEIDGVVTRQFEQHAVEAVDGVADRVFQKISQQLQVIIETMGTNNTSLNERITTLDEDIGKRFDNFDNRIKTLQEDVNGRFKTLQEDVDGRFQTLQQNVDARFQTLQQNVDDRFQTLQQNVDARFQTLQQNVDGRFQTIQQNMDAHVQTLGQRIDHLQVSIMRLDARVANTIAGRSSVQMQLVPIGDDLGQTAPQGHQPLTNRNQIENMTASDLTLWLNHYHITVPHGVVDRRRALQQFYGMV